ncbi:hypothetical protein GCM10023330_23430 [Litoribaculum gwangyangense]|uniref:Glycoside hydrolase family 42 N-terminal domain-containing protein n=1 Tax=Litoribaculum gwangyangense TaxID=1130722 RepID=A0ABP9CPP4_9FLAO
MQGQDYNLDEIIFKKEIIIVDYTGISLDDQHPVAFGKRLFFNALEEKGGKVECVTQWRQSNQKVNIVLGTLHNIEIMGLVSNEVSGIPVRPEGVFYQWQKTESGTVLVVGGTDAKGLMYALNELAERIKSHGLVALSEVENTVEYPENNVRGLDKFVTDQNDDNWFFSDDYWQYYLTSLATNRFNRLTLITGYNDGKQQDFMIPVYPYLFDIPGFENVSLRENLERTPQEYLNQLKHIGQLCHSFGLDFVFGIWGHGRSDELILGLPEDAMEYTNYCARGMYELLRKIPEIDGIQLRVNYESGVGGFGNTADNFWKEIIKAIVKSNVEGGDVFLDIRAKGLTDTIREFIESTNLDFSVTSKYSWEGVGLPYHPTEMRFGELSMLNNVDKRQRYGYADFLKYSRKYDFIYRLWGIGTMRMFTWADPDYARRFSFSSSFGNAKGFQVTPPMSRKQNTWPLFQDQKRVYYQWEDERYWAWYLMFGRLGYSTSTNPNVWEREFKVHYGSAYRDVLKAYEAASKILPLITSSHLTFHPANYNWAEIESGGALFVEHNANPYYIEKKRTYQSTEPGDPGIFYGIEVYVEDILDKQVKPKINPRQLSQRYADLSKKALEALSKVNKEEVPENHMNEYVTNEMDIKILSNLGFYHSYKIKAATDFVFFKKTNNKAYLKSCLSNIKMAKEYWVKMLSLLDKLYFEKPRFLHDNGTWKDRLVEIEKDIEKVENLIGESNVKLISHWDNSDWVDIERPSFEALVPEHFNIEKKLEVVLKTDKPFESSKENPKIHYRSANMAYGKFKELAMDRDGKNYKAIIPFDDIDPDYDLLVYFSFMSKNKNVVMFPGLLDGNNELPYFIIKNSNH